MSKSYSKKMKFGICSGSNTDFYKERRKTFKKRDKQAIRNTLAHFDVEDFDEKYKPHHEVFKDDWNEPTDGTILATSGDDEIVQFYDDEVYLTKDKKFKR